METNPVETALRTMPDPRARTFLAVMGTKSPSLVAPFAPDFDTLLLKPGHDAIVKGLQFVFSPGQDRFAFQRGVLSNSVALANQFNSYPAALTDAVCQAKGKITIPLATLNDYLLRARGNRSFVLQLMQGSHLVGDAAYSVNAHPASEERIYPAFGGNTETESQYFAQSFLLRAIMWEGGMAETLALLARLDMAEGLKRGSGRDPVQVAQQAWQIANGVPVPRFAELLASVMPTRQGRAITYTPQAFATRIRQAGLAPYEMNGHGFQGFHTRVQQIAARYNMITGANGNQR